MQSRSNGRDFRLTQGLPNGVDDFGGRVWLLDHRECAGGVGALPKRGVETPGDQDDREDLAASAHFFEQLDPAHFRHMEIEDQAVSVAATDGVEKFLARGEFASF